MYGGRFLNEKILSMLKESNDYVSGQEICDILGVSRTAVWKHIKKLEKEGYKIEAVTNKGYILKETADILSGFEIKSEIRDCTWFANDVYIYDEIDSTNNECKRLAENGAKHGSLVVAKNQTSGKGRRGRKWCLDSETGVAMTLLLRPDIKPSKCPSLTLVAAMAMNKAIREVTNANSLIKWPNDIVVNGKKVTGILTEMSAELDMVNYIVIGLGINVNTEEFDEDIACKATSLKRETGKEYRRSVLISKFGSYFEKYYDKYLQTKDMSLLMDEYNEYLVNVDNEVTIMEQDNSYKAIAKGINNAGELIIKLSDNTEKAVSSGEVSVRGIYGYV